MADFVVNHGGCEWIRITFVLEDTKKVVEEKKNKTTWQEDGLPYNIHDLKYSYFGWKIDSKKNGKIYNKIKNYQKTNIFKFWKWKWKITCVIKITSQYNTYIIDNIYFYIKIWN